jgi:hypothetical protein
MLRCAQHDNRGAPEHVQRQVLDAGRGAHGRAGRLVRAGCAVALAAVLVVLVVRLAEVRGQETDLFPRWYGLRQLFLTGRSPYSDEVSREIAAQTWFLALNLPQAGPVQPIERVFGFLYLLPGALLLAPLALLPYPAALAVWLLGVLAMLPAAAWLVVDAAAPRLPRASPVRLLALLLGLLIFPTLANLALAQPAPAVAFLVALAAWLWTRPGRGRAEAAGVALAAATALKPQLLVLATPLWLAAGVRDWRRGDGRAGRFLLGALGGAGALTLAASALLPSWPIEFLRAARHYPEAISAAPAVLIGWQWVLPEGPALAAAVLAAVAGVLWAAHGWWQGVPVPQALARTLVATALAIPPAWETNAVILLVPLAAALARLGARPRAAAVFVAAAVAVSIVDIPLYLTLEWRRGAAIILGYAALLAAGAIQARDVPPPDITPIAADGSPTSPRFGATAAPRS